MIEVPDEAEQRDDDAPHTPTIWRILYLRSIIEWGLEAPGLALDAIAGTSPAR